MTPEKIIEELRRIENEAFNISGNPPEPPDDKTLQTWYMIGYRQAIKDIVELVDEKSIDEILRGR